MPSFGRFVRLQPVPLVDLPVPYDAVMSACCALPSDLGLVGLQGSANVTSTRLLPASNLGVVISRRERCGSRVDQQREKACQLASGCRHRRQFASFIEIVADVGYAGALFG